MTLNVRNL